MLNLRLTPPTVQLPSAGAPAPLEQPLTLASSAGFNDGRVLTQTDASRSGVYVYRTLSAGAPEEIWDVAGKRWRGAPSDPSALELVPFDFKADRPEPWQALLVAFGQKDTAGAPIFGAAGGGYPTYRARAYLAAKPDGQALAALSAPSADWTFVSSRDNARFSASFDTETAQDATWVRFALKDGALRPAGFLEIRTAGANALELTACNASGGKAATIVLSMNGEIQLLPASGSRVLINGDLECNRITYLKPGALTRSVLP